MLTCFHSVRKKLHRRSGFFDLLGFDFMIDENFKVMNPSVAGMAGFPEYQSCLSSVT